MHIKLMLKEPIQRKLIILAILFVILVVILTVIQIYSNHLKVNWSRIIKNEESHLKLSNILYDYFLDAEMEFIRLDSDNDIRDVVSSQNKLSHISSEIQKILTVLQNGGQYNHTIAVNFYNINEIKEKVYFSLDKQERYNIEKIELTPKLMGLIELTKEMIQVKNNTLDKFSPEHEMLVAEKDILLKKILTLLTRSKENANKIKYDVGEKFNSLSDKKERLERSLGVLRYVFTGISFLIFLMVLTKTIFSIQNILKDREKVNTKLKKSFETTNLILEKMPIGLIVVGKDKKIRKINAGAKDLIGVASDEDIKGKLCHNFICTSGIGEYPILDLDQKINTEEKELLTVKGEKIPVIKSVIPVVLDDEDVLLETFIDIREKKKSEEIVAKYQEHLEEEIETRTADLKATQAQLIQAEKLASIGQLAAGIAHEINNPMGFIGNNIEIFKQFLSNNKKLLDQMRKIKKSINAKDIVKSNRLVSEMNEIEDQINLGYFEDELPSLITDAQKGVERVKKIVLDMRTFAREDKGQIEDVDINKVLDDIIRIVWTEIKYNCDLKKDYGDIPFIKGSPQKLGQVFINFFLNASQAIDKKGQINIKTYAQDSNVYIEICDTGKGIEEKNFQKIFDAFYTSKPIGEGTGLGLSISSEIIKKHGGNIKVESQVGKGTTFIVSLPVNTVKEDI